MRVELVKGALELECDPGHMSHVNIAMTAQLSSAISLKRIADALEKLEAGINTSNEYGETGAGAIAGALMRGLTHAR